MARRKSCEEQILRFKEERDQLRKIIRDVRESAEMPHQEMNSTDSD